MRDPLHEHAQGSLLRQSQIDALVADGIPPLALTKTGLGLWSMVRRDHVVFHDDDTFTFVRHAQEGTGRGAFTFLCFDDDGEPLDVAAWRPPTIATWLGRPYAIGQENANQPRLDDALPVHGSVLDWFRHGRCGIYILKYQEAAIALRNEVLGVPDAREVRALRSKLTLDPPPIVVEPIKWPCSPLDVSELAA